jgi:hypothetical protein
MKLILLTFLTLISVFSLKAQDDAVLEVTRLLEANRNTYPAMRPQVFFSQDKYAPGDTAFFRLFILTETERILAERSLFTIELVDHSGVVVMRQVVTSQIFGAANQLILPESLEPGAYEVRLFSERMTTAYGLTARLVVTGTRQMIRKTYGELRITFHPEGGHLVPGALNRLVIRAQGRVPESASLNGEEGRIAQVEFEDGLATVHFIPREGQRYKMQYVTQGVVQHVDLPRAERDAVTLRVYQGPKKTRIIDISSGAKGPRAGTLYLVTGREVLHSQGVRFNGDGKANVLVADDFFPEGFSELFLLDKDLKVLSYRPVYRPATPKATVSISQLPESMRVRTDAEVLLSVADMAGQPQLSSLSISVIPEETRLIPLRTPDASLELRHVQPQFDWTAPESRVEKEIIARCPAPERIVPEYPVLLHSASLNLSGRAYSTDPRATLPYLSRIVLYLHKDLIQYEAPIGGNGNFHVDKIYDFMGSDKIFYKVIDQKNHDVRAKVDWSQNLGDEIPVSLDPYEATPAEDAYGVIRNRKRTIDRSFNYFLTPDSATKVVTNFNADLEREFRDADITIRPSEYVPFETMRELILEVIPALKFRVHGIDSVVEVTLTTKNPAFVPMRYAEGNPLYVIDGYMTTNTRYLMSLSPHDIEVVKIINEIGKLDKLQNLARDGVLFIQTRIPERTRRDLEKELYPIAGLSPTLSMPMKYPTQKRVPDLRSLLYWTPLINTDSTGVARVNFRTSDLPGPYWIRIMGVTATGHLFTAEKRFEVTFK